PAIEERLGFPVVVKPADQGSALGIRFAPDAGAVPAALVAAFSYSQKVLLERAVDGRELAVSILGDVALPIAEAIPIGQDFYAAGIDFDELVARILADVPARAL